MTQRYAGMLRRNAGELDKQEMPVQAECLRQAARHMEELHAAKDALEKDAARWQPIETAPKKMPRAYLVVSAPTGNVAPHIDGVIHNCVGSHWDWNYGDGITHWMPLPAPPAIDAALSEKGRT